MKSITSTWSTLKLYTTRLKEAIRKGLIRFFPSAEEVCNAFLRFQFIALLFTLLLVCCSCGSTKMVTQTVEHVTKDTIYLNSKQYDSIYIYKDRSTDYRRGLTETLETSVTLKPDTLFIKDVSIEYRYKLLRDTIRWVERDSIPYEVTITEVKEIQRPLTAYDKACRITFWFVIGFLLSFIVMKFRKGCF